MSTIRCVRDRRYQYITLDLNIFQDPRLSFEGKGIYGMLEAEKMDLKDVPEKIIKELFEVGYLYEGENLND